MSIKPITEKINKLYVLRNQNEYLYVGITKQSLRERLRSGFNAKGENGYHGYKWKNLKQFKLFVWAFKELTDKQLSPLRQVSFCQTRRWIKILKYSFTVSKLRF